jgi:hypothetical protein
LFAPLSDIVTCPRCGPAFGLIMLADRVEDRRAYEAWLGCANCRERYRIQVGYVDLRFGAGSNGAAAIEPATDEAARLAAFLGITEGPALVLLVGAGAVNASALADMVEGLEVVASWSPLAAQEERVGVSRFASAGDSLPYRSGTMSGVALTDEHSLGLIEEAARVVMPRSRVVIASGSPELTQRLERAGLNVLAKNERATVAQRTSF